MWWHSQRGMVAGSHAGPWEQGAPGVGQRDAFSQRLMTAPLGHWTLWNRMGVLAFWQVEKSFTFQKSQCLTEDPVACIAGWLTVR